MKIERIAIGNLTPDPANARSHDEKNLRAIEASLREFGQRKPKVVTADGVVVAGNGTIEAAKRLGWKEIDIVRVPEDWDSDRIKAYALADNRTAELASWETEVLNAQLQELKLTSIPLAELGFEIKNLEMPDDLFTEADAPRLDQRNSISCPQCGCEFRQTAKGFEIV